MERWKPERCNCYWVVDFGYTKKVRPVRWDDDNIDTMTYNSGNCFKTEAEAQVAAEKVRALLLSLHEPVTDCNQLPKLTAEVFDRPDCPEWAKYAAVDECGSVRLFSDAPWLGASCWNWSKGEVRQLFGVKFDASNWQNSRIKRPKKDAFDKLLKKYAEQQADKILQKAREHRLSEQYGNAPEETKLPDWCKVGEWVYLSNEEYDKIESIDGFGINLASGAIINKKYIHEEAVPARLRPWNFEEAPFAVKCRQSITASEYQVAKLNSSGDGYTVADCCCDVTLRGMAIYYEQIDGSPCGVLEHRENGKWVK